MFIKKPLVLFKQSYMISYMPFLWLLELFDLFSCLHRQHGHAPRLLKNPLILSLTFYFNITKPAKNSILNS